MKAIRFLVLALTVVIIMTACAAPTPVTTIQTVVVPQTVEKQVPQTVVVPQTVEKPVVVTATPYPVPSESDIGAGLDQFNFKGVEIRSIFWDTPVSHAFQDRAKIFAQKTGATVAWEIGSEEEIRAKLELDQASKAGKYTMIMIDNWELASKVESGAVYPIDDYLKNKAYPWLNNPADWCKPCIDAQTYKGHLYGIPWAIEVGQMAYRTDLFAKYNVKVPTTIDELFQACSTLEAGFKKDNLNMKCISMRGRRGEDNPIISAGWATTAYGGQWLDDKFVPHLNSPEFVAGVKAYTDILKKYGPADVANYTWIESQKAFAEGQVAIVIDGQPVTGRLQDPSVGSKVIGKIGYAPPPKGPKGYPTHLWLPGWGVSAYASQQAKDATWAFITWITSNAVYLNMGKELPGDHYLASPALFDRVKATDASVPPLLEVFPFMKADYQPVIPDYPEIRDVFGTAVSSVIAGETDAKTAMDKANQDTLNILQKAGYYK